MSDCVASEEIHCTSREKADEGKKVVGSQKLMISVERRKVWISTSHRIKDTGKGTDSYVGTFPVIFCDLRSCILVEPATDGNRMSLKY